MQIRFWNVLCVCLALTASACGSSSSEETTETASTETTTGGETAAPEAPVTATTSTNEAAAKTDAQPEQPPAPQMPKHGVVIIQNVKDVAKWQAAFDSHQSVRKEAGFFGHSQSEVIGKPKTIVLWLPAMDLVKVDAFLASDDLKAKMKEAGVVGKPTIAETNVIAMSFPEMKPGEAPVYQPALMVTQSVKDFAAFKAAFDAGTESIKAAGINGYALSQDAKDANVVYLYLTAPTVDPLKAWWNAKETKKWNKDAGLKGAAKALWTQEKSFTMYQ